MRSVLITAAVLAALVAGFVVFLLTQKSSVPVVKKPKGGPASMPALREGEGGVAGGEGGWVQSFDKKTGELTNEFRADHFDPPVNNRVHVVRPDARFYSKDGSVLTLSAGKGDITMAESARKADKLGSMQGQPPSHGILYDVKLGLLETADDTVPVLTCTLPIVAFDNDTLRLNTIPLTVNGQEIPADQIPVTVRGRDYDFDGQGLLVRYNQRDRRLELLEVAHGKRLVIKNPKAFGGGTGSSVTGSPLGENFPPPGPLLLEDDRPIELASADPEVAPKMSAEERERRRQRREVLERRAARERKLAATQQAAKAASRPHEAVAYQATFNDAVTITEGGTPVGDADRMVATFTFDQNANKSTTQPVVAPAGADAAATQPVRRRRPATTQAATLPAVVQPTSQASTQPTTRSVRRARRSTTSPTTTPTGPIEIKWTGKLTVVPQKLADSGLRSSSDRIVEFTGKPVHLQRDGSTIVAAYIWAAIDGNRFLARPDATTPLVTLTDPRGTVLKTESIEADGADAILHGRSSAELVLADAQAGKKLRTTWTEFATIRTATVPGGPRGIERASFRGNVVVDHPQLKMTSDTLALGFVPDEKTKQSQLSAVRADGKVNAAVTGEDGSSQQIKANALELATAANADGSFAVRSLHAAGDVIASDAKQTLRADDLTTQLAAKKIDPTAGPASLAVESLRATGRIDFATADGSHATGDLLEVKTVSGAQWVSITGTPARVSDSQQSISGSTIRADTTGGRANIDGPGTLTGSAKTDAGKPGQPINVAWTESMTYDGAANSAMIRGNVVVTSRGDAGTINTARGRTLEIAFVNTPTTQPATNKPAGTQPFGVAGGAGKQLKSLTLIGSDAANPVEISSLLYSATEPNKIIRRTYVWAPAVTVNANADGSPGAIDVPSAGTMLYEDITPAVTTPNGTTKPSVGPLGGQGAVAIEWKKRMHYDPAAQQAVLDGDVKVVRRAPGQDEATMLAPRLIAEVSDAKQSPQGAQLKRLTADQGATMFARKMRVDAARAVYEPATDRLTATGSARQPVQWFDEAGLSRGSFGEMVWNLKTNQPEKVKDVAVEVNR